MTMTNEEICQDYRQAKAPTRQIGILAELNQCGKDTIKRILVEGGEKLPGNMVAPGERKTKPKPEPKTEPEEVTTAPMEREPVDMSDMIARTAMSLLRKKLVRTGDAEWIEFAQYARGVMAMWDALEEKL